MKLQNKLLIATPSIEEDTVFAGSLIYISSHDDEHTRGFIINKFSDITLRDLLNKQYKGIAPQLDEQGNELLEQRLLIGGPIDATSFFCLHEQDEDTDADLAGGEPQLVVSQGISILEKIANGKMASRSIVLLGRSEWGPRQLEREIVEDSWIIADSVADIIFAKQVNDRALLAAKLIGVDLKMMVPSLR